MKKLLLLSVFLATPALTQNLPSGSQRVQGVPDGYGDPVQVTIVGPNGADGSPTVVGNVAHDVADSGAPIKIGGFGSNAVPTAVNNNDRVNAWFGLNGQQAVGQVAVSSAGADASSNSTLTATEPGGTVFRLLTRPDVFNGTSWDRMRGDTNGNASTPGLSSLSWSYSNGATGILSNTTTAVTIKTAAGASVRNYIDSCQINSTAFGASVPLAIRDGAGGTVIWAVNVPTAGFLQPVHMVFNQPLRGTANTLLEVVTTTANTSGTVWVNCQGHTGA